MPRLLHVSNNQPFFLFGARGTGKSTLLENLFKPGLEFPMQFPATGVAPSSIFINLLNPELEERFSRNPNQLAEMVRALPDSVTHIIIDEIQKVPKLLDVVHYLMGESNKQFVLTGSSARKLKQGGANLLAGRAFVYYLYPFSFLELGENFNLQDTLQWGMLPKLFVLSTEEEKQKFLQAYALTYLKEEIWAEQFIRALDPFRYFLEVAAQMNGKMLNFEKISNDVGVDDKTIKRYYSILEDTLIGFFLQPFHHSFRKRISSKLKFYFFDIGVTRALSRSLTLPVQAGTSSYREIFEHFIILEIQKLVSYFHPEYRLSYLTTKDHAEIDLVVERPGAPILFIEIKSAQEVAETSLTSFIKLTRDFGDCVAVCLSNDLYPRQIEHVRILPWMQGIKEYFC